LANPSALGPAIAAAAPGDTVVVSGTCRGSFTIDKDLTLRGTGRNPALDARGAGRVLGLNLDTNGSRIVGYPWITVRLEGLTITGAAGDGIESAANTSLTNVIVRGNGGRGINAGEAVTLEVIGSTVRGNRGGGIATEKLTLDRSLVASNGGVGVAAGWCNHDVLVVNSVIERNAGRGIATGCQGGLVVESSTIRENRDGGVSIGANAYFSITDSAITGNATPSNGGGVHAASSILAGFHIVRSTITGNRAGGDGGGVYAQVAREADEITATTISGNVARRHGGGLFNTAEWEDGQPSILHLRDTSITRNKAGIDGGGIYNDGVLALERVTLTANRPNDCIGC
jgi:hypothetical protein